MAEAQLVLLGWALWNSVQPVNLFLLTAAEVQLTLFFIIHLTKRLS
jgi:hypothetical protein